MELSTIGIVLIMKSLWFLTPANAECGCGPVCSFYTPGPLCSRCCSSSLVKRVVQGNIVPRITDSKSEPSHYEYMKDILVLIDPSKLDIGPNSKISSRFGSQFSDLTREGAWQSDDDWVVLNDNIDKRGDYVVGTNVNKIKIFPLMSLSSSRQGNAYMILSRLNPNNNHNTKSKPTVTNADLEYETNSGWKRISHLANRRRYFTRMEISDLLLQHQLNKRDNDDEDQATDSLTELIQNLLECESDLSRVHHSNSEKCKEFGELVLTPNQTKRTMKRCPACRGYSLDTPEWRSCCSHHYNR